MNIKVDVPLYAIYISNDDHFKEADKQEGNISCKRVEHLQPVFTRPLTEDQTKQE